MAEPRLTSLPPVQHQSVTLMNEQVQQLQLITHMATYGNMLVAVSGYEGSGKTTLALEIIKRHSHPEDTLYIAADLMFGIPSLLRRIGDLSNTPLSDNRQQAIEQLNIIAQQRAQEGRTVLVLIDQAEQLDIETLNEIAEVAKLIPDGLAFILFGKSGYELQFHRSVEQASIHVQALEPLSKDSAQQLLMQHFKTSDLPFSDAEFLNIYQLSLGWPGELLLHALERKTQAENTPARKVKQKIAEASQAGEGGKKFPVMHLVALALLASALGVAYVIQPADEPEETVSNEIEDVLRGPLPAPTAPVQKVVQPEAKLPNKVVLKEETLKEEPLAETLASEVFFEEALEEQETPVVETPHVVVANEPKPVRAAKPAVAVQPAAEASEAKQAKEAQAASELDADKARLLAIKQGVAIQVFGSHSLENATNFKQNWQSKINQRMYLYPSLHQGKAWYVVVVGVFNDKRQAGQSIKQWPAELKRDHWVRNIQDVQQAIR